MRYVSLHTITEIGLYVFIAVLVIYDIFPAANKVMGDTISEISRFRSLRWLFLPIACGILMGHLFGPLEWRSPPWMNLVLIPYGMLWIYLGWKDLAPTESYWIISLLFALHLPVGAVFWSQGDVRPRMQIENFLSVPIEQLSEQDKP